MRKTLGGDMTLFLAMPGPGKIVAAKDLYVKNSIMEGANQIV